MIKINIRKQGGAAIMTIPTHVMRELNLHIGETLVIDVETSSFNVKPQASQLELKRYSLKELLTGTSSEAIAQLNKETSWAREDFPKKGKEFT